MSSPTPSFDRDDERAADARPDAVDSAFVARLAGAIPRSNVNAATLHYEAGRLDGAASVARELRVYRGLALGSAAMLALTIGVWSWRETQRALDVASPSGPTANDLAVGDATPATDGVADDRATIPEDLAPEVVSAEAPAIRQPEERTADRLARTALERRYLASKPRVDVPAFRWKDLYDRTSVPVSIGVHAPRSPSPVDVTRAPDPWSARPSADRINDLIDGI